jgi:hypothetical protein
LGDYFLQPEVIFASDALKYSALFMVGFVFLSTFFGKIVETLNYILPKQHNSLQQRLARTRVLACWPRGWMPWERQPTVASGTGETIPYTRDVHPDDEALIYRIEKLKEVKPDPPVDDEVDGEERRGIVSSLTGKAIHSMNVELLQEEESLLREWLDIVVRQKEIAIAARTASSCSSSSSSPAAAAAEDLHHFRNLHEEDSEQSEENKFATPKATGMTPCIVEEETRPDAVEGPVTKEEEEEEEDDVATGPKDESA